MTSWSSISATSRTLTSSSIGAPALIDARCACVVASASSVIVGGLESRARSFRPIHPPRPERDEGPKGSSGTDGYDGARRGRDRCESKAHRPGCGESLIATLFTDGGARGNPGPAGSGYVLEAPDGTILASNGRAIGVATNNVAEYQALIDGLAMALELGLGEIEVVSDSQLLVKQMTGEYRVKNSALIDLSLQAKRLAKKIGTVRYKAVPRERNELADRLVNEALDAEQAAADGSPW